MLRRAQDKVPASDLNLVDEAFPSFMLPPPPTPYVPVKPMPVLMTKGPNISFYATSLLQLFRAVARETTLPLKRECTLQIVFTVESTADLREGIFYVLDQALICPEPTKEHIAPKEVEVAPTKDIVTPVNHVYDREFPRG